jgi:hypothetical protein
LTFKNLPYAELKSILAQAELALVEKKTEEYKNIVDLIIKSKISKEDLQQLLIDNDLLPISKPTEKVIIYTKAVTTKEGRSSNFKIWTDREVWKLTADAFKYWLSVKAEGKQTLKEKTTAEGKKWFDTAEGQQWLDKAFA